MKRFFSLLITLGLVGCSATTNALKKEYETHNQNFDKHNSYKEYQVPRGKYHLYAREFNQERKGKAPTILLMHGFPDSLHLYDELIPYLENYHVIAFDYLGWGESDKPKNHYYNSKSLYDDMDVVVNYFHLKDIIVVVHDASGPPGIDWAVAHPQKVNKLVLLNTYYQPMKKLVPPEAIARFSTPGVYRDISVQVSMYSDTAWIDGFSTQIRKFMMNDAKREHYVNLLSYQSLGIRPAFFELNNVLLDEMKQNEAKLPLLKTFKKPVSIVFGKDDPYLNVYVAKTFKEMFPHTSLTLVQDAGHYVQIDQPKEVASAITKE
ncbi:MAG TPA: alpha/beta hydrolase [Epsilonproteobacteria bacterium]|nr:alpha/beta hydrolase [Campylobacterota bacterium]